jgi:hypothetical protein
MSIPKAQVILFSTCPLSQPANTTFGSKSPPVDATAIAREQQLEAHVRASAPLDV